MLRQYRLAAGLSQEELAERAAASVRGISDLERGQRRAPHPATARRLADALNLDPVERAAFLAAAQPTAELVGAAAPLETRYARSGDVNIAYQVIGHAPVDLVFVMGWVSHLEFFWQEPRFARFLRRLASFARVIVFDKRGTGLSDRGVGLPTLEQRMDDVRAVLDAVGSERAALMGISEGGALCALFAATYPRRTAALALVGCFPRRLWAADYPWGAIVQERERLMAETERGWGSVQWAARDLEHRAPSVARDEQFRRWWATYLRMSASPGAALAVMRMNSQIDIRSVLPSIHVPALVVHRKGDRSVAVQAGRYLAAHIPGARYIELPGDDHLPFVGDQDAILDALQEFLTGPRLVAEPDRVLATVLALDIAAPEAGEPGRRASEAAFGGVVGDQLDRYRGRAARISGTGVVATFDGPARGIRCALAILDASRRTGTELRAALHTGECDVQDGQLGGVPFRIATAALAHAGPGDVLVSSTVRDLVAGSGLQFDARAQHVSLEGVGPAQFLRVSVTDDRSSATYAAAARGARQPTN